MIKKSLFEYKLAKKNIKNKIQTKPKRTYKLESIILMLIK